MRGALFGGAVAAAAGGDDLQPFALAQGALAAVERRGARAGGIAAVPAFAAAVQPPRA